MSVGRSCGLCLLDARVYDKPGLRLTAEGMLYRVAGLSSKIHLAVDSNGNPIDFEITGGEVHDAKVAPAFVARLRRSDYLIADKGYDSDDLRDQIRGKKSITIFPRKRNSKTRNADIDWGFYKLRHLVENAFARLKHFRGIATRFDKLKRNYAGAVALACAFIWLPLWSASTSPLQLVVL